MKLVKGRGEWAIQLTLTLSPKNSVKMTLEEISKDLGNQKAKLVDLQEGKKQEQKTELQETKNKLKDEVVFLASWARLPLMFHAAPFSIL